MDETQNELKSESEESLVYVSQHFFGDIFEKLVKQKKSIISPLVLKHCIQHNIVSILRLNFSLNNVILCDKGFATTEASVI